MSPAFLRLVCILVLLFAGVLGAQTITGEISGTVPDHSGTVVPGAYTIGGRPTFTGEAEQNEMIILCDLGVLGGEFRLW